MKPLLLLLSAAPLALPAIMTSPVFATALIPAFGTSAAIAESEVPVVLWKGKVQPLSELGAEGSKDGELQPDHLAAVSRHIDRYLPWVLENDYRFALTDDARVLLISSNEKLAKRRLKVVAETLETFDEVMPAPDRSGSDETFRDGDWGVREHVPDSEPVVLIEVGSGSDYQSLLGSLEKLEPDMQTWTSVHATEPGFDEVRVMAAAWQSAPAGFEVGDVWRSENELVNRLSRLLTYRSFGPQPTWLSQSTAWIVEQAVMGDIYCFPYRAEFVSIAEHTGWEKRLKGEFKKRKDKPLDLGEFADWKRGDWDLDYAAASWGFTQFLSKHKPGALSALAEANRLAFKAGFTIDHGDGTWSTNPAFEVGKEAQLAALQEVAGADVMEEASEYFRTWKRYKPAKKKRR